MALGFPNARTRATSATEIPRSFIRSDACFVNVSFIVPAPEMVGNEVSSPCGSEACPVPDS
ncbi:hypothetical protein U2388_15135, partial [Listeria monocytogenes]